MKTMHELGMKHSIFSAFGESVYLTCEGDEDTIMLLRFEAICPEVLRKNRTLMEVGPMFDIPVTLTSTPKEKPKDESKLGFGKIFTDHMFVMDYELGRGW